MLAFLIAIAVVQHPIYHLVPFSQTVDEQIYREVVAGKLDLPEGFRVQGDKLVTTQTVDRQPAELMPDMCGMSVFKCHYDNEGSYFVPDALYRKLKGQLIQNRQGRLESFATPNPKAKPGELPDPKDKTKWEVYIWDAEGKVWRSPVTLGVIKENYRLKSGDRLYDVKHAPGLATSPIGEIAARYTMR